MRTAFALLGFALLLHSCISVKRTGLAFIPKGQTVYHTQVDSTDRIKPKLIVTSYTNKASAVLGKVKLDEDKGRLKIEIFKGLERTGFDSVTIRSVGDKSTSEQTSQLLEAARTQDTTLAKRRTEFVFPVFSEDAPPDSTWCANASNEPTTIQWYTGKIFRYQEFSGVVQAITVPVKIRFAVNDSIGSTTESGFNAGYAFGYRKTWHRFRNGYACPGREYLQSRDRKYAIMGGLFLGPLVQELNKDNTEGALTKSRSYLGLTGGALLSIAMEDFSIGLAGGLDLPIGGQADKWNYYAKPWLGIVLGIGLDIFK